MIILKNVNIQKNNTVFIQDVNLEINKSTLILGENNSGKTELLKCICGKHKVASGSIVLADNFVNKYNLDKHNNGIMFIPKNYMNFFKHLSVRNIISFFTKNKSPASSILKDMKIDLNMPFNKLSYIQMLSLFIHVGVRNNKKIFAFDEPDLYLDFKQLNDLKLLIEKHLDNYLTIITTKKLYDPFTHIENQYCITNQRLEKISL